MKPADNRKYIDLFYNISLLLKGISASIETLAGFLSIFVTQNFLLRVASFLTQDEITEDPHDRFAHFLFNTARQFSNHERWFVVWYLLTHGVVKLLLVLGLYYKKLWAYPLSLAVLMFFIVYQVQRYLHTHSIWLLVLTIFDIVMMWLIWKEYKFVQEKIRIIS